ncbi:hypothetical protein [Nocardioides sp. L-11A]|uniref:hypothetical protein n=1 Tax=Nocardioides sp. L-11A TaxID=3043848 RepID=UPI00249AD19D|nr:hypothetical protein QJ852_00860 [Nocardioides sp. L-11A]
MLRLRLATLLALVTLTATGLLTAVVPAGQAAAPRVDGTDVPNRTDVVRAIPGLKGVALGRFANRTLSYYDGVCSTWERVDGTSGKEFGGVSTTGDRAVSARVIQFPSKAAARRLLATFRAFVRECGQHWAGVDTAVQAVRLPKLGDQRVAFRTTETFAPEKNLPNRNHLTAAVRQGKRLLVLTVELPDRVRTAPFVRLARVAARKMG